MARLVGPDEGSRLVYGIRADNALTTGGALTAIVYSDAAGTVLADILTYPGGVAIPGSVLTVGSGSLLPLFQFPDGVNRVYVSANGGTVAPVNVDQKARLDQAPIAPSIRSVWRDVSSIVTNMQAGHGWTASGAASSNLNDTVTFTRGTQSASITTNGTGTAANLRRLAGTAVDLTGKALRLVLRVSDLTLVNTLNFFVGTGSLANNFKWRFNSLTASSKIGKAGEWIVVTLQWSELNLAAGAFTISATGAPSVTTGFTDLQIQVTDLTTGPVTVWLQAVEIIDAATTQWPKGIVSVTFDDSNSSANLARPKMDTLGYRGTQYTIADAIGTSNKLTLAELRSLQNMSGWEIAGHSYAGAAHTARYPTLTAAQVDDDLRNLRSWLVSNGFTGDSFAYPGGQYENTTDGVPVSDLVARYFSSGRTILSSTNVSTHSTIDAIPAAMPHRLRGMSSISSLSVGTNNPTTLTAAGGMLDKVAVNGGWLGLVFHQIVTGVPTAATDCSQTDFNTIMDAIASRGIPVLPVSEVLRRGIA